MNTGPKTINPNKFHAHTTSILSDREPAPVLQFVLLHTSHKMQTSSFSTCLTPENI